MRFGAVAIGGAVATLLAAAPAGAAISYFAGGDSVAAGTQDSAKISCAIGQRALGGAISSNGSFETSSVNSTTPADGPDADSKPNDAWIGFVDSPTGTMIQASVACVDGATAQALKYRSVETNLGADQRKSVTAECPDGYKVTGGGVANGGLYDQAELKASYPVQQGTAWRATVQSLNGASVIMSAEAICARGGFAKQLSYRLAKRTVQPGTEKGAAISCPGSTAKGIGGGVRIGKGNSLLNSVGILADGSGSSTFVDAVGANPINFKAFAVCYK